MKSGIKYWFVTFKFFFPNLPPVLQLNTGNTWAVSFSIRLDGICTGCTVFFNSTWSVFNYMYMYLLWARDSPAFIKLTIAFLETLEIDKRYYKYREKHDKNPKNLITILFMSKALFWGNISRVHVDSLDLWVLLDKLSLTGGDEQSIFSEYLLVEPVE